jgi:hypothetical protein
MNTETIAPTVPALAGAFSHLRRDALGWIDISFKPIEGRSLTIDVRPEGLGDRDDITAFARHAAYRWLAAVRDVGLLPLALDARLPARTLARSGDAPSLSRSDITALVDRLRPRVADAGGPAPVPFPDVLIRVADGEHQVRVAGSDRRVLAMRDALAVDVMGWLAIHGAWWDAAGSFAVKLEPGSV